MKAFADYDNIISILNKNGIIIYPSDTILGLGCDATSFEAIEKIFKIKQRDRKKKLVVLASSASMISNYVTINEKILDLIEKHHRPISIVYNNIKNLPRNIIAKDGSVVIRIVKEDCFCKELIEKYKKPLISTSVNISGNPYSKNLEDVDPLIIKSVNLCIGEDFYKKKDSFPSDIAKIENDSLFFIRKF